MGDRELQAHEVAKVDQVGAKFREITPKLIDIHKRTANLVARPHPGVADVSEEVDVLQKELYRVLDEAFIATGDPNEVFSYLMFLIDVVAGHQLREERLIDILNKITNNVVAAARVMGASPDPDAWSEAGGEGGQDPGR